MSNSGCSTSIQIDSNLNELSHEDYSLSNIGVIHTGNLKVECAKVEKLMFGNAVEKGRLSFDNWVILIVADKLVWALGV